MAFFALELGILCAPFVIDSVCRITSSAQGIYSVVNNISSFTYCPSVVKALKELDISTTVNILESLIKELNVKHESETLNICIESLKESVREIEKELLQIQERLMYNKKIWVFSSVRSYKFHNSIERLKTLKNVLNDRIQWLERIMKLIDHLTLRESAPSEMGFAITDINRDSNAKF
jgi:hypothetical protein